MKITAGDIVLQRYELEQRLGEGAMGEVWRGRHQHLHMPVAIKFLLDGEHHELPARFRREARLMARVNHPNIVQVMDFGLLEEGIPCIVMELLAGMDLEKWRHQNRETMCWEDIQHIGTQLLRGLATMHAEGIIHRDIKPANIMISSETLALKIVDFGIAKPTDPLEKLTETGVLIGTPAYMSPEQLFGQRTTARTDIYSVGLMLYELLSGDIPFGDEVAGIMRRLREPLPPLAPRMPCPEALVDLIISMLAHEEEDRPDAPSALDAISRISSDATPAKGTKPASPFARIIIKPKVKPGIRRTSSRPLERPSSIPTSGLVENSSELFAGPSSDVLASTDRVSPPNSRAYVILVAKLPAHQLRDATERAWLAELAARNGIEFVIGSQFWGVLIRNSTSTVDSIERIRLALFSRYGNSAIIRSQITTEDLANKSFSLDQVAPMPKVLREMMLELI